MNIARASSRRPRQLLVTLFVLVSGLGCAGTQVTPPVDGSRTVDANVKSLLASFSPGGTHEGVPLGVPSSYDWQSRATVGRLQPPSSAATHGNLWGEVYPEARSTPAAGLRVAVRDASFLVLYEGDATWTLAPRSDAFGGGAWRADFHAMCDTPLDMRVEADGSRSFLPKTGCNAHFWPVLPFVPVNRGRLRGAMAIAFTRVVNEDGTPASATTTPPYLIALGADFRTPDGSCPILAGSQVPVCTAFGHGRYVRPGGGYRIVIFSTVSVADLDLVPLPDAALFRLPDGSFPPLDGRS